MNAYIISGLRTAVGKAHKGGFQFTRPDDLAAQVIRQLVADQKNLDPIEIDDVIVGNAVPEAEQGMQMGRIISLLSLPVSVPGLVVNRYCGSGIEAIAMASSRIHAGLADVIIAGGAESMSLVPTMGWKTALNVNIAQNNPEFYSSMGLTAENVAKKYNVSREDQDKFSFDSHQKAISAIKNGLFKDEILPIEVEDVFVDNNNKRQSKKYIVDTDEGPREDTSLEILAKLRPVFAANGTVTAGNSSQTSDGAAFVMIVSERMLKKLNVSPIAKMLSYAVTGVDPAIMGIGPIYAIPKSLKLAGLKLADIDLIELNEAFASQAIAVKNELGINPGILNVNGGAIALGHPLGCTGAKLTIQIMNELRRRKQKYGIVSACVGGGQGVSGIFEMLS